MIAGLSAHAQATATSGTSAAPAQGLTSQEQKFITLGAAIDSALKNNLSLRGDRLNAAYLEKIRGTAYTIPQTNVSLEFGQINSAYNDNKLILSQSIRFPTVYTRQRSLYEAEWKNGVLTVAIRESELKRQVTQVYFSMVYLQQKQKLLEYSDSVFGAFLKMATLRFEKGETNILEKTTAVTQAGQITLQLATLQQDFAMLREQFRWLLHTGTDFIPDPNDPPLQAPAPEDTSAVQQHPFMKQLEQQQRISTARWMLEKSKLSPDLFAAYNNLSMRGDGADGKTYTGSTRFQSVQVGVGIPLFAGAQKAAIAAGRVSVRLSENNYLEGLEVMQTKYRGAMEQYRKCRLTVRYFESTALNNADTIISTVDRQFRNGAINYLEWVLLVNNAVTIRSDYIDAVKNLNMSIIEINYLTNTAYRR